ncbi:MAG TPA: hypothetical protein VKV28_03155 [Candidatus Binataceae bacterium]|nr:hypothetical protein [Candidatus Binataceae bacterium]
MQNVELNGGSRFNEASVNGSIGFASAVGLATVPALWAQSGKQIFNSTNNNPQVGHAVALANPSEHPGNTMEEFGGEVQWPGTLANFVAEKISEAKAKGMDTREAEVQERLAVNW